MRIAATARIGGQIRTRPESAVPVSPLGVRYFRSKMRSCCFTKRRRWRSKPLKIRGKGLPTASGVFDIQDASGFMIREGASLIFLCISLLGINDGLLPYLFLLEHAHWRISYNRWFQTPHLHRSLLRCVFTHTELSVRRCPKPFLDVTFGEFETVATQFHTLC
jgi:hypothetical protein